MLVLADPAIPGPAAGPDGPVQDVETLCRSLGDWPGPHVLVTVSARTRRPDWTAAARARFLVLDLVPPAPAPPGDRGAPTAFPTRGFAVLRPAVLHMASRPSGRPGGPLLYAAATPGPEGMDRARQRAGDPLAMDHEIEDGALTWLLLGRDVVANPLFPTFFRAMDPAAADADVAGSLSVLRQHLVPA